VSYIPAAFAQNTKIELVDTGPGGIYARLEDAGHILARFTEEVGVASAYLLEYDFSAR